MSAHGVKAPSRHKRKRGYLSMVDEIVNFMHAPETHNFGRPIRFPVGTDFPLAAESTGHRTIGNDPLFDPFSYQAVNPALRLISIC
jgi:hypothetical protein